MSSGAADPLTVCVVFVGFCRAGSLNLARLVIVVPDESTPVATAHIPVAVITEGCPADVTDLMGVAVIVVVRPYSCFSGEIAELVVAGGDGVAGRAVATVVLSVGIGQTVLLVIAKILLLAEGVIPDSF